MGENIKPIINAMNRLYEEALRLASLAASTWAANLPNSASASTNSGSSGNPNSSNVDSTLSNGAPKKRLEAASANDKSSGIESSSDNTPMGKPFGMKRSNRHSPKALVWLGRNSQNQVGSPHSAGSATLSSKADQAGSGARAQTNIHEGNTLNTKMEPEQKACGELAVRPTNEPKAQTIDSAARTGAPILAETELESSGNSSQGRNQGANSPFKNNTPKTAMKFSEALVWEGRKPSPQVGSPQSTGPAAFHKETDQAGYGAWDQTNIHENSVQKNGLKPCQSTGLLNLPHDLTIGKNDRSCSRISVNTKKIL